ncbi:MAG: spondin domain-containing protein [Deltaproteobacteria bacterium]|nr:spondin domain-containing protein [Deltaproteobacteria bacterium]
MACTDTGSSSQPSNEVSTAYQLRIENVAPWTVLKSGTHGTGPIGPGETFALSFTGGKGHSISFATMYGESNDWFFAPGPDGIPLVDDDGVPMAGDVTKYVKLWNAGTEIDQEPAVGDATAPRQPSPNYGAADPDPRVRILRDDVSGLVQVTLVPSSDGGFTLEIMNCVTSTLHLSPLVWALHRLPAPLFTPGLPDRGGGLEALAEDGMVGVLGATLAETTGFHTPLSPGVVIVHRAGTPIFRAGEQDFGDGLESIAEDGNPMPLAASATAVFDTPVGGAAPGPAMPGQAFEVEFLAAPGDRVSFSTMFGMSNDWFFASREDGIPIAIGDVTAEVALHDLGTEIDQELDIGRYTAPQQPGPNTGPADPNTIVRDAAYDQPTTLHMLVTITEK